MRYLILLILLALKITVASANPNAFTTCMGGFNGERDLLLVKDGDKIATKSNQAILLNNEQWELHDQSKEFLVYKKSSSQSFLDEYVLLIVSNDGKHVSYYNAATSSDGPFFEMEEFTCSGF